MHESSTATVDGLMFSLAQLAWRTGRNNIEFATVLSTGLYRDLAARLTPPAATEAVAQYTEGFLCRAWGETTLPEARFVHTEADWRAFIVHAQWGDEATYDALDAEDREMVDGQAKYIKHDMADNSVGEIRFEIGGMSVERVTFSATPPAASPVAEPVAFVPVHPRLGPLWMETFGAESQDGVDQRRAASYPVLTLFTHPAPSTAPVPVEPRMLTEARLLTDDEAEGELEWTLLRSEVHAIQRKFCEVNGIRLATSPTADGGAE